MTNILLNIWIGFIKVLFTFLHIIYSGLQYLEFNGTLLKRKWEAAFVLKGFDSEQYVSRFVTGMETPTHLAVIVGDDAIKCQDFTNLIVWCLAAGISFLTVYDQRGKVKDQETKFYKYFLENTRLKPNQVVFRNLPVENGKGTNGFKKQIFVSVLSSGDGKESFVSWVRDVGQLMQKGQVTSQAFSLDVISEELETRSKFPDPELAVVVAPQMCMFGFPPWNLRLTEFVRVPTLEQFNVKEFCGVLQRYAACEKRIGK